MTSQGTPGSIFRKQKIKYLTIFWNGKLLLKRPPRSNSEFSEQTMEVNTPQHGSRHISRLKESDTNLLDA